MQKKTKLRYGWTTGTCATAAAKAAYCCLFEGKISRQMSVLLPKGGQAHLTIKSCEKMGDIGYGCVIKDGGDDPDVTHGALVECWVRKACAGEGIVFKAGEGVGTVTLPGLALSVGEPAINPIPRKMMCDALTALNNGKIPDIIVTIGIRNGREIAKQTLNGRLGIKGGLSILGTTGIVVPFSCAAWIETIHRSIDVARRLGQTHLVGATGDVSGKSAQKKYHLSDISIIEMGDFIGGFLKYIRRHRVQKITIAAGPGKMTKIAQGQKDLRAKKCQVDKKKLRQCALDHDVPMTICEKIESQPTVGQIFKLIQGDERLLGDVIAHQAYDNIMNILGDIHIQCDVIIFDRKGHLIGYYDGG